MADSTIWWLLAGLAVGIELITGTFFLLMFAIGLAAGAIAAHAGGSVVTQLVVASLVGGGAVAGWYAVRQRRPQAAPASSNADVNLDIGVTVNVERWNADGTATVKYRGATWTVVAVEGGVPVAGPHRVREVQGSRLVVESI